MKIRKLAVLGFCIVAFASALGAANVASRADEADPLVLPCTIGAIAVKKNPYSQVDETYKCEQCGSETCWIVQPAQ